jgi:ribulose-phosphate 3-epimerase
MNTLEKARRLRDMIQRKGVRTIIEVDGGIDNTTAPLVREAGVDAFVAGSFVFGAQRPKEVIFWLKNL